MGHNGAFLGASATCGLGWGGMAVCVLATRPPRSTWFQSSPSLICSGEGWGRAGADRTTPEGAPLFTTGPASVRLRLLPLSAAPVVRGVVSSATAAFKLFFGGRAPAWQVGGATRDAPRCITATTLGVSEALTAPALQRPPGGRVGLHSNSEPT